MTGLSAPQTAQNTSGTPLGMAGVLLGALALIVALVTLYFGPFAPQQDLSISLGELAGDTIKATARELFGRPQPETVRAAPPWTLDDTLQIGVVVASVVAILCAIFAAVKGGQRALIAGAASLAAAAIAVQFFAWMVAMVVCALLIVAVFSLIGGIFG